MKWITYPLIAASLLACDLNEGPREETREAVEAARDGQSAESVHNQLDDVKASGIDDRTGFERDLDRELRKTEKWAEEVRRDLAAGTRKADERFDRSFEAVEHDLRTAREDYDRLSDTPEADRRTLGESLRESLRQISVRVDALDGEVDDQPGPDPHGPG